MVLDRKVSHCGGGESEKKFHFNDMSRPIRRRVVRRSCKFSAPGHSCVDWLTFACMKYCLRQQTICSECYNLIKNEIYLLVCCLGVELSMRVTYYHSAQHNGSTLKVSKKGRRQTIYLLLTCCAFFARFPAAHFTFLSLPRSTAYALRHFKLLPSWCCSLSLSGRRAALFQVDKETLEELIGICLV